jgi:hypothetical protein
VLRRRNRDKRSRGRQPHDVRLRWRPRLLLRLRPRWPTLQGGSGRILHFSCKSIFPPCVLCILMMWFRSMVCTCCTQQYINCIPQDKPGAWECQPCFVEKAQCNLVNEGVSGVEALTTKGCGHLPVAEIQQHLAVAVEQSALVHKQSAKALERQAQAAEEMAMSMGEVRDSLNMIMQHMQPCPGSEYPEWPGIRSGTMGPAEQVGLVAKSSHKCQHMEEIINLCEDDEEMDE